MLFEIVIVLCVAFAAAGCVMLVAKLLGRKFPKTLALVAAGIAMLAYVQWDRYSWADRYAAALPAESQVVMRLPYDGWAEPWARIIRRDDALLVVDHAATLNNPDFPHIRVVTTLLVERNRDTLSLRQFVDCVQHRRAPILGNLDFTAAGLPAADAWVTGGEPKALYDGVCGG